jgi:CopG family transcriptional regulator, nickel-responsive regulator
MAGKLARFGISMPEELLKEFDSVIRAQKYTTRSKAIEDLVRQAISDRKLSADDSDVIGSIDIVYDHHRRELLNKLADIQHDFHEFIVSSQHTHLDHHNCYELIVVRGKKAGVCRLADLIKAAKGVKHSSLRLASV